MYHFYFSGFMQKKAHHYHLTLQYTKDNQGTAMTHPPVELDFTNHDDIFAIIERLKSRQLFSGEAEATEFAIGLKLFSEVLIRNRKHPLFEAFGPAFSDFMTLLKSGNFEKHTASEG